MRKWPLGTLLVCRYTGVNVCTPVQRIDSTTIGMTDLAMAPQVFLHIGMNKTGSTSIQATLKKFDDGRIRYAHLNDQNHSIPIYSLFSANKYDYHIHKRLGRSKADIDQLNEGTLKDLERELSMDRDTIIMSGEDISLLDRDGVNSLLALLKARARSVKVMAYVRPVAGFASSAFQQYIAGGMKEVVLPKPNYRKRFEAFVDCPDVDDMEFIEFSRSNLKNGSVVSDFCARTGIDEANVKEKQSNVSMSLQSAQLIYHFNRFGLPSSGSELVTKSRNRFVGFIRQNFSGEKFSMPNEMVRAFSDMDDVLWMEGVSGMELLPKGDPGSETESLEDVSQRLEEMIGRIDQDTQKKLQECVAAMDKNIAKSRDVTGLLNFIYCSIYFEKKNSGR